MLNKDGGGELRNYNSACNLFYCPNFSPLITGHFILLTVLQGDQKTCMKIATVWLVIPMIKNFAFRDFIKIGSTPTSMCKFLLIFFSVDDDIKGTVHEQIQI